VSCSVIDHSAQDARLWLIQDFSTPGNVDPLMSMKQPCHIAQLFVFFIVGSSVLNQDPFRFIFSF